MTTTKSVLAAMRKGATLCKGFVRGGRAFWLHPSMVIVSADLAERIIALPGVKPNGDGLFEDASQTWKLI